MAHTRQPRPDSGLGFQAKVRETFHLVPSSLRSGGGSPPPSPRFDGTSRVPYFIEMCSGSEAGSYLRHSLLYHSTLGVRVIKKKKKVPENKIVRASDPGNEIVRASAPIGGGGGLV